MHVSFSASGQKRSVVQAINDQTTRARNAEGNENNAAAIMSLRDKVLTDVNAVGDEDSVSVSASISISLTVTAAKKPAAEKPAASPISFEAKSDKQ